MIADKDIRTMTEPELAELAGELREKIIDTVAKNGGHLASSLGAVELIMAVHCVFDTSRDRLVFDVGHQSYAHKLLTGREESFGTLRRMGGISGFPKPAESEHDAFIAGHASAAVSVALGMARARTLRGEDYRVIALLGDGALTGGLAYEALCDAGASGEPLIVILNDNGMSIAENVGGMAKYLSSLRLRRGYRNFKTAYRKIAMAIPGGKYVYNFTHKIKTAFKQAIYKCEMFEDLGFTYVGPVDGHDINELKRALEVASDCGSPVIVHAITVKGKGYAPAEADPELYHGVSPFDREKGVAAAAPGFSSVFGEALCSMAELNSGVIAVTAAMAPGTGLAEFAKKYPRRFFDVGIAEEHAASMCAGAARQGLTPVFAVYSTFLQRAYDMLIHDIGILGEHVILAVDRAGVTGEDGETHQGEFDAVYLRSVPGMTVLSPSSFAELRDMLTYAVFTASGPVALRYPRGGEGEYKDGGAVPAAVLREGEDFTIVTYGINVNDALAAARLLEERGISAEVVKLGFIKPWDRETVAASVRKTGRLLVLEESVACGCLGEEIGAWLGSVGLSPRRLILKNLGDSYVPHGSRAELLKSLGMDAEGVAAAITEALPRKAESYGKREA